MPSPSRKPHFIFNDCRGGRNGADPPWAIDDNQVADAVNVDFYRTTFGHKRGGMIDAIPGGFTSGGPFTGIISSIFRFTYDESISVATLLLAVDDAATPVIAYMGSVAAPLLTQMGSVKDVATGNSWDWTAATVNGKFFLSFKSAVDRLHVWDTRLDSTTIRRTGLGVTVAPTAADATAGAYAAVLRYYRQRSTRQSAGVTILRSEPSPSVAFTPDAGHGAARVTQAAVLNEGETHWEVEASIDNVTFYRIATVAIATTTYDDSAATTSYNLNPLSAITGTYTAQKAYKFIAGDQNRLLGLGSWTATDKQNRVEISAVVGSLSIGDEERVDSANLNSYIDFDEADSGVPTGLAGPVDATYFLFKELQTWQLTPTGEPEQPYRQDCLSKTVGAISQLAVARGEDAQGNPALYWMSRRGHYRWTKAKGIQYIGRGIEDLVLGPTATINLAATNVLARAVYYTDKRQVTFWWTTGNANDPNVAATFDIVSGGWSRVPTGDKFTNIRCVTMFSNTPGATPSKDLKPWVGQAGGNGRIWKADTGLDDNGTTFRGYLITKAVEPGGPGFYGAVGDPHLLAVASSGVTISVTALADFGIQSNSGTALLTPDASETRVSRRIQGGALDGDLIFVQYQIGDAAAATAAWTLDRLLVPVKQRGETTG